MIVAFLSVLLLTTFVTLGKEQACPDNFFGENCMYRCMCFASCNVDGTCTTKKCKLKYFGPMCQYYDGINAHSTILAESFIHDNDEGTCNPNPAATYVRVILSNAIQFLWFRIYVRNRNELLDFIVKFNQTKDCLNMRKFPQDNFVDVTCDNSRYGVQELLVDGPIARKVCSLYISLGRNAALKQNTSQSSTLADGKLSLSQNAVDGKTFISYNDGSCTQTKPEDRPEWRLTYNRPQILLFVQIWNRDELSERLSHFTFEGLSENNFTNTIMTDKTLPSMRYRFSLRVPPVPTRYLRIQGARRGTGYSGILTLCEVLVYSETVCPFGTFGLWCQKTCACQKNETCNSVTGVCAPGCPKSFYGPGGFGCSLRCSNCQDEVCDQRGNCDKCIPGYKGDKCNTVCKPGFYGQDCALKCSQGCVKWCASLNGACSCRKYFAPPNCKDCEPGYYGQNCTSKCSNSCAKTCDRANGTCLCRENLVWPDCIDCEPGFYGQNCMSECSNSCAKTCDRVNGTCSCRENFAPPDCIDCEPGYYGQNCTSECSNSCAKTCDRANGTCLCSENLAPPDCIECTHKFFGPNCDKTCPGNCKNGMCHDLNGNCFACLEGYTGLHCEAISDVLGSFLNSFPNWSYIAIPVCIGLAVVALVLSVCVQRKDKENPEMSEGSEFCETSHSSSHTA